MGLRELFTEDAVKLDLESDTKDGILSELVGLLGLDETSASKLYRTLKRRENLGSTGIGKGIAIPHWLTAAELREWTSMQSTTRQSRISS